MALLFLLAFGWLSMRTLVLLAQLSQHTPEAQLGRAFRRELHSRGLIAPPLHPGGETR